MNLRGKICKYFLLVNIFIEGKRQKKNMFVCVKKNKEE